MNDAAFRVRPLDPDVADRIRSSRRDATGRPVVPVKDGARHQCRACLTLSGEDEEVLLVAHRPFTGEHPYAETGPIFVHARPCAFTGDPAAWPAEMPRRSVTLRAYDAEERIADATVVGGRDERSVEDGLATLLADPRVAFVHARNAGYGCFIFRVDRA